MKKRVKKMWASALDSGDYEQGEGELVAFDADGMKRYCCLGVLCDLAIKDGLDTVRIHEWSDPGLWTDAHGVAVEVLAFTEEGEPYWREYTCNDLPQRVQQWAGITSSNPTIDRIEAIRRNDNLLDSFAKIAKHIRRDKTL